MLDVVGASVGMNPASMILPPEVVAWLSRDAPPDEMARRYACDRCRGQKLRCERIPSAASALLEQDASKDEPLPCRRCLRAGATCVTSPQLRGGRPRQTDASNAADTNSGPRRQSLAQSPSHLIDDQHSAKRARNSTYSAGSHPQFASHSRPSSPYSLPEVSHGIGDLRHRSFARTNSSTVGQNIQNNQQQMTVDASSGSYHLNAIDKGNVGHNAAAQFDNVHSQMPTLSVGSTSPFEMSRSMHSGNNSAASASTAVTDPNDLDTSFWFPREFSWTDPLPQMDIDSSQSVVPGPNNDNMVPDLPTTGEIQKLLRPSNQTTSPGDMLYGECLGKLADLSLAVTRLVAQLNDICQNRGPTALSVASPQAVEQKKSLLEETLRQSQNFLDTLLQLTKRVLDPASAIDGGAGNNTGGGTVDHHSDTIIALHTLTSYVSLTRLYKAILSSVHDAVSEDVSTWKERLAHLPATDMEGLLSDNIHLRIHFFNQACLHLNSQIHKRLELLADSGDLGSLFASTLATILGKTARNRFDGLTNETSMSFYPIRQVCAAITRILENA